MKIFVTGGIGFVGSQIVQQLLGRGDDVTVYDIYDRHSVNPNSLPFDHARPTFIKGDILDSKLLSKSLSGGFDAIIHCAAIAAVDRSIREPDLTIKTNAVGTLHVFEGAKSNGINRIHYLSTDEVFGEALDSSFDELSTINPRNPYAAGKLSGEAVALAWAKTYGMYVTITNCCNTFGEFQSPDKLIPRLSIKALLGEKLPVYGSGQQEREWIHVSDHASAALTVLDKGVAGERYCIGTGILRKNMDIVNNICAVSGINPKDSIEFVEDRPGHDLRYALNSDKIKSIGWQARNSSEDAIRKTIQWYLENQQWWSAFHLT